MEREQAVFDSYMLTLLRAGGCKLLVLRESVFEAEVK